MKEFSTKLIEWQRDFGRNDLPWQKTTPYEVWISEIILQQTQVVTAIPYFNKFISKFPNLDKLSNAKIDQILAIWSGLGFYARARNIYKAAKIIKSCHRGKLPRSLGKLTKLPGIGKSTAGAIISLGYKQKAAILDGNVKRVLSRYFKIQENLSLAHTNRKLWKISEKLLPKKNIDIYNQAIMDIGALICTKASPSCKACPLNENCLAFKANLINKIPYKKKTTKKPLKTVHWLIPQNSNGEILLEKRKKRGIWEGLWSFIESKDKNVLEKECKLRFKDNYIKLKKLKKIKYSFSHYRLEAIPYSTEINMCNKYKNTKWVSSRNIDSLGIPAPIKKFIQGISSS